MVSGVSSALSSAGRMTQMRPPESRADRAAELFKRVDQNGDGGVDQAEFSEWAVKMAERDGATAVDATAAMAEMDQDGDGLLSQTELDSGMPAFMEQMGGGAAAPTAPGERDRRRDRPVRGPGREW